jgi:hypothetical protein
MTALSQKKILPCGAACLLLACALSPAAFAQTDKPADRPAEKSYTLGKKSMNGYSLEQYPELLEELNAIGGEDGSREWHFVTVRYRRDTGEIRWTYANQLAWKTLSEGRIDYPDGAAFAKVGIGTQDDPDFTSSVMPGGAKRFQLMVYDAAKNKNTDGWGYALFDGQNRVLDENDNDQARACHACHEIVAKRNYVFSIPVSLAVNTPVMLQAFQKSDPSSLPYETYKRADLPKGVQNALPAAFKKARALKGKLQKYLFQGTIDEIRPALAQETVRSGIPTVLFSENGQRFSLVYTDPDAPECGMQSGDKGLTMWAAYTMYATPGPAQTFSFCQPKPHTAEKEKTTLPPR